MVLSSKSSSLSSSSRGRPMKFRPPVEKSRSERTGTRPVAEAASVGHILGMMLVHLARKALFGIDLSLKVGAYLVGILVLSVIGDFGHQATHYMSRQDNFLNQYFVKFGWGWTFMMTGPFVFATSYVYSCGDAKVVKNQLTRLAIATGVWYAFTSAFLMLEERSGMCNATKFLSKASCVREGHRWKGFDISGHCFLLMWNNFFMIEEAKAYLGWEKIKEALLKEEHRRLSTDLHATEQSLTSLSKLKPDEFLHLRDSYKRYTPYVRLFFCFMAVLVTLWDVMVVCTALYFHIMIEKVVAASLATLVWFVLYRGLYTQPVSVGLPGEGPFKYVVLKAKPQHRGRQRRESLKKPLDGGGGSARWTSKEEVPKFMGMPLYALNNRRESADLDAYDDLAIPSLPAMRRESVDAGAVQRPLVRARSRSSSRTGKNALNAKY